MNSDAYGWRVTITTTLFVVNTLLVWMMFIASIAWVVLFVALFALDGVGLGLPIVVSVPLCPTKDHGVLVGAPAVGYCDLNVSELKFNVTLFDDWWGRNVHTTDDVFFVHNLDSFDFVMTMRSDKTKKLEQRFVRDSGSRGETLTMGEIMRDLMSFGEILVGESCSNCGPRWDVSCPVYPTLATRAIEPNCSLEPFYTPVVGLFEKTARKRVFCGAKDEVIEVNLGKLRATVSHNATPALYFVSIPWNGIFDMLSVLAILGPLLFGFGLLALFHEIYDAHGGDEEGISQWYPAIRQT